MSQPKRRSRKSKLVPRSTDGGEPEIEEIIESEEDAEPPFKITKTISLAGSQSGPSKSTGSIQFKVDIEVEEWIDDELFIEENFNKMQSEKLSKALDKKITEEADWTNEEYGKFWAEAASDSEPDEKPLNEYEKIIKNQVDPSVLAGPSKDRSGTSKDSVDVRPGTSTENCLGKQASRGSKKNNKPNEGQKDLPIENKKQSNLDKSKHNEGQKDLPIENEKQSNLDESKPNEGQKDLPIENKNQSNLDERQIDSSKDIKKEKGLDESDKSLGFRRAPPKNKKTTPASADPQPPKPIRQYKRPGPKSKTIEQKPSLVTSVSSNSSTGSSTDGKTSLDPSIYEKTFKWSKKTANVTDSSAPKPMINILYSDNGATTYHIDLSNQPNIDLPTSSQVQTKTMLNRKPSKKYNNPMKISKLDELATTRPQDSAPSDTNTMVELRQLIITEEAILSDSKLMATTSIDPTDRFLDIEVRNRMGSTRFVPMEMSREDALIDFALRQWFQWLGARKVRGTPLTYKCYICNDGWWHLHQFREHLKEHVRVNVALEKQKHECNIIAYINKSSYRAIPINGECWKCGKHYPYHLEEKYSCEGCQSILFTCKALAEHQGVCLNLWKEQMEKQKTKDIKAYKCKICPQIFFTEELLHNHQYRSHVPRSDYPMWVQLSQCNHCHQNYVDYEFHYCRSRVQMFRCKYCSRHFPSITALKSHTFRIKNNVVCNVCKEVVLKECMMPRHLLVHNKNYVMVYKCLMCVGMNILLDDVTMVTRHAEFVHKSNKYVRSMWCYAQIPLPVTLFSLKKITTKHTPTPMHDKLKESFLKDFLQYDPIKIIKDIEESQVYSEEKDSQDSSEPQDSQESSEAEEAPTIKIENVMENYFEEDSEFKPNIDISSIKVEINENVEGTEVTPADVMDMTVSEFVKVVKKEPDDDTDMSQSSEHNMEVSNKSTEAGTSQNVEVRDFSEQLLAFLCNRDGDNEEGEINDNINICLNCDFEGTKKEFKAHLKKCDSGEMAKRNQELTCTKCKTDFESMKNYVKHLPKHGFVKCTCTECDREFPNVYNWMQHIKMHIRRTFTLVKLMVNDSKLFRCRFCKEFVERKMFFSHWEGHLEVPQKRKLLKSSVDIKVEGGMSPQVLNRIEEIFGLTKPCDIPKNCILCGKNFNRTNEKKRHLVEHLLEAALDQMEAHGGLVCQYCGVKVIKPDAYRRHMREHAGLTMYHCEMCNKTFSDSSNFVKHKKVHDVATLTCDDCNKKFLSKASLEAHIATHRPEPLLCPRCPNKEFYSESAYNRHVRSYHDRHCFKCQYCRLPFPSLKQKWDHLWETHCIRSQIADCPMCGKKFRKSQDVRNHIYNDHHVKKVFSYVPVEETSGSQ